MSFKRPSKTRRTLLLAVVAGAAVWFVFFLHRTHVAERELEDAVAELRARGEPATVRELLDRPQPEPNGAADLMRAVLLAGGETAKAVRSGGFPEIDRNVELVLGAKPGSAFDASRIVHSQSGSTPAQILSFVERSAAAAPGSISRNIDEQHPHWMLKGHVWDTRLVSQLMQKEMAGACERGDPRRAYGVLLLMAKLSDCLAADPFFNSQFVRVSNDEAALKALGDALGAAAPDPAEFAALDRQFARWKHPQAEAAIRGERCMLMECLDPEHVGSWLQVGPPGSRGFVEANLIRIRLWYLQTRLGRPELLREKRLAIRFFDDWNRWLNDPEGLAPTEEEIAAARASWGKIVPDETLPGMRWLHGLYRKRRLCGWYARLALRVARHREATGEYPADLFAVADAEVPAGGSPWTGGWPPIYTRGADGFTISEPDFGNRTDPVSLTLQRPVLLAVKRAAPAAKKTPEGRPP